MRVCTKAITARSARRRLNSEVCAVDARRPSWRVMQFYSPRLRPGKLAALALRCVEMTAKGRSNSLFAPYFPK
jgi:hypothetical protein